MPIQAFPLVPLFMLVTGASASFDSSPSALSSATSTVVIGSPATSFWSGIRSHTAPHLTSLCVTPGTMLSFLYSQYHNVWEMPSADAYGSCNFSGATELASDSVGGGPGGSFPNSYNATVTATVGQTLYLSCDVGSHCAHGQKISVQVSSSCASPPPPTSTDSDDDGHDHGHGEDECDGSHEGDGHLHACPPPFWHVPPPSPAPPAASDDEGCGGGCIGAIVGGSFVPVLMLLLWLSGAFGPKCPSPLAKSVSDKPITMSGIASESNTA